MKENALLVRPLDIVKVYVDFSNIDNIYKFLDAERLATIHTKETQAISNRIGIHIMGFATREGDDINNKRACEISGYDYIGSLMLLCKTDDKFNALPLDEAELECLYEYLTTGKVIPNKKLDSSLQKFMERYGIKDPLLPNFELEPDVYYQESIPYMIYLRYDLNKVDNNGKAYQDMGAALFYMADRLVNEFPEENGVHMSPDGRYYINCLMDAEENVYHVLMQAVDEEDVDSCLIRDVKANVRGFLGQNQEPKHVDMDTAPEEAGDIDDDDEDH